MRRPFAILSVALFVAITSAPAAAQTRGADRPADSAAIRAHIESIFQAFVDKDRAKLVATHGAEWRGFTPWSGHVIRGRDGYMNEATFPPDLPKAQGMVGYRGQSHTERGMATEVFVSKDGHWLNTGWQPAPLTK